MEMPSCRPVLRRWAAFADSAGNKLKLVREFVDVRQSAIILVVHLRSDRERLQGSQIEAAYGKLIAIRGMADRDLLCQVSNGVQFNSHLLRRW